MSIPASETTLDAFLGGRLHLRQPARGYRAGADPVLLAASIPAVAGQSVLDLGCGVGAALLCLGARVPDLSLTGVEIQPDCAGLARQNAMANDIAAEILVADIADLPPAIRQCRFDHVIANPPYFDRRSGTRSPDIARETAFGEHRPLSDWVAHGARRLEPRGCLSVIQRAERLPDLLTAMAAHLGSLRIRPIQPRAGRDAVLVIVQGLKGGRGPARIEAPLILHDAPNHRSDNADYSATARAILRHGAAFP